MQKQLPWVSMCMLLTGGWSRQDYWALFSLKFINSVMQHLLYVYTYIYYMFLCTTYNPLCSRQGAILWHKKKNKNKKGIIHLAWQGSWSNRKKDSIKKKKDKLSTYSILSQFLLSKHLFLIVFLANIMLVYEEYELENLGWNAFLLNTQCFKNKFLFLKKITTSHVLVLANFY